MAKDHARGDTPQVNPNRPFLPRNTRARVADLAAEIGIAENTLRRWVKENNTPFRSPGGGEMWVDTEELWNSWANREPQKEPKPPRGGRRKKESPADGSAKPKPGRRTKE